MDNYPQITDNVRTQLVNDPRLPYPGEIAVEAFGSSVTLRGTVGSFAQQHAAVKDARRAQGVLDVLNELEVRILDQDRREDAEIRGAVLQRLIWAPDFEADFMDVEVEDGWVTLKGEVDYQFQSDSVFERVTRVRGVTGVTNELKVVEVL
jgi:osmotically-inducible protein OsmY